jgi:tRNA G10  N-methylase Trm11
MNAKEQIKEHTNNLTYFFIFGNNPALSLAEIKQFIPADAKYVLSNKFLIVTLGKKIDAEQLIDTLGGTIKIGRILCEELDNNLKMYSKKILPFFNPRDKESKYYYGFSVYGNVNTQTERQVLELGMTIKKELKSRDIKCRFVTSKEPALSSVIVQNNKLVSDQGVELCFLKTNGKTYIGKTLVVQDFKTQSTLDYDRPAFDSKSGMIPPKLAKMMVNLARKQNGKDNQTLLDPFCGSGTVLQEAFLYSRIFDV